MRPWATIRSPPEPPPSRTPITGIWRPGDREKKPVVKSLKLADDGMYVTLDMDNLIRGHVYEFDLGGVRAKDKDELLHRNAYYTVNEVPMAK